MAKDTLDSSAMDGDENKKVQSDDIQIDLSEDVANGVYSNFVVTNMNSEEFVFDFTYLQPYANKGSVRSRVIMSPRNAKKLHQILTDNLAQYDAQLDKGLDDLPDSDIGFSIN